LRRPVAIDDILDALCELDSGSREPPGGKPFRMRPLDRIAA
jgi:hypothetical protein